MIMYETATVSLSNEALQKYFSRHSTVTFHFPFFSMFHFPWLLFTSHSVFFPHRHSLPPDIPRLLSLILHMATIFNARYRVLYPATRILRQSCGMFELRQHYSNRYFRGSSVSSSASNSPLSHCVCLCSQGEKKSYLTS